MLKKYLGLVKKLSRPTTKVQPCEILNPIGFDFFRSEKGQSSVRYYVLELTALRDCTLSVTTNIGGSNYGYNQVLSAGQTIHLAASSLYEFNPQPDTSVPFIARGYRYGVAFLDG